MKGKTFVGQNPFEVWGIGEQIRNWTHVDDIVEGTILAAEKIDDGTAINLGGMERISVLDAVEMVLKVTGHRAEIATRPGMPTGPLNRVADNSTAKRLPGWEPKVAFWEGLGRTIEWYFATKGVGTGASSLGGRWADRAEGGHRGTMTFLILNAHRTKLFHWANTQRPALQKQSYERNIRTTAAYMSVRHLFKQLLNPHHDFSSIHPMGECVQNCLPFEQGGRWPWAWPSR